jgi:hypothetical protein
MEKADPEHSEHGDHGLGHDGKDILKAELRDNLETARDVPAGHAGLAMTPEEAALNRRVSRKMDICMLPLLSLLYLFNGLDKSNIGNAQTQGSSSLFVAQSSSNRHLHVLALGFMQAIGAQPTDLNYATSLFFITFVIFQPISAGVGRWIGPKNWIPIMMVCEPTLTSIASNAENQS